MTQPSLIAGARPDRHGSLDVRGLAARHITHAHRHFVGTLLEIQVEGEVQDLVAGSWCRMPAKGLTVKSQMLHGLT